VTGGSLAGHVVLVTGAGSGIGEAIAAGFRGDSASVVGCDLAAGIERARAVSDLAVECDVTDPDAVAALVAVAIDRFGRVDTLIANAGIGRQASILAAEWGDIEEVVRVNLFGVLHCIRAVLPPMIEQGRGRIAVLSSRNAEFCPGELVGYNASKAAVFATVRTLAHELRTVDADVLVNCMIPGPTRTGMNPAGTQEPAATYPTARFLATLPEGGPCGRTFWNEEEYPVFARFSG